ncbi:MAG: hypothetical protein WKF48_05725 [Solirubrobacteraceae bacterium]
MDIDVIVRGDDQAQRLLDRLARRLHDGTPQLYSLVDELIASERDRFAGRGVRWRKLARASIRAKGGNTRPLVLTGLLMDSLTQRGHPQQLLIIRPTEIRFGTRVWYARFPQKGQGQPKRIVVGLSKARRKSVTHELRELLLEGL